MKTGSEWCDRVERSLLDWLDRHHAIGEDISVSQFIDCCKIVDIIEKWRKMMGEAGPVIHVVVDGPESDLTEADCCAAEKPLQE